MHRIALLIMLAAYSRAAHRAAAGASAPGSGHEATELADDDETRALMPRYVDLAVDAELAKDPRQDRDEIERSIASSAGIDLSVIVPRDATKGEVRCAAAANSVSDFTACFARTPRE